jgi:hypothetical protein
LSFISAPFFLPNPAVCNLRRGFSARQVSCQVVNTGIAEPRFLLTRRS